MKKYFFFFSIIFSCSFVFSQTYNPWERKVYMASSINGIDFTRDFAFSISPAAKPSAVIDSAYQVLLYYVKMESAADTEKIMVTSSPDGDFFSTPQEVIINGSSVVHKSDPCAVMLPDWRIRLFYLSYDHNSHIELHHAASSDGVTFTEEPGISYFDSAGISNPDVFKVNSLWNLFLTKNDSGLIRCSSIDGYTFQEDSSFHWNAGGSSSTMQVSCGLYRSYLAKKGIISATFGSSIELHTEDDYRIMQNENEIIGNPTVIIPGSYIMYFDSYSTLSIPENKLHNDKVQLYPNPAESEIIINIPGINENEKADMTIYNSIGDIVHSEKLTMPANKSISVNVNNKPGGFYVIKISTLKNIYSGTFIKN